MTKYKKQKIGHKTDIQCPFCKSGNLYYYTICARKQTTPHYSCSNCGKYYPKTMFQTEVKIDANLTVSVKKKCSQLCRYYKINNKVAYCEQGRDVILEKQAECDSFRFPL